MLYRRWFYLGLGLIVVVAYARLFWGHAPLPSSAPVESEAVDDARHLRERQAAFEAALQPARVIDTLAARPGLMMALSFWTAAVLLLLVGGMVLNFRAASIRRLRRIFRYRTPMRRIWSLQDVARLALLLVAVASLLPFVHVALNAWGVLPSEDQHLWGVLSMGLLHVWVLLLAWGFASAKSMPPAAALGLPSRPRAWSWRHLRRAVRVGLTGYVALIPWIMGLLWLIVQLCRQLGIQPPLEPIQEMIFLEERAFLVGATVVLACLVGPVVEEVLFRGILFNAVRTHSSRLVAMLISGGIFSALHTNLIGFVPILVLGCLLADLYERTGSLVSCISVHIVHNVMLMSLGLIVKALAA